MRSPERPRRRVFVLLPGILIAALAVLGLIMLATGGHSAPSAAAQTPAAPGKVVLTTGVGGVLTSDGGLWVYRPDKEKWLTIDDAFKGEGRSTKIEPLPVPVEKIQDMATWGFILTTDGELWLYDMTANVWKSIPPPPEA